jgi:uncharacterized repeat protein (TIGR01451 family)
MSGWFSRVAKRKLTVSGPSAQARMQRQHFRPGLELLEDRVVLQAGLSVQMSGLPQPVLAGQALTLTEVVTNTGNTTATAVTLADTLPAGLAFISASGPAGSTFSHTGATVNGTLGDLAAGASATVNIQATPIATGAYTNSATASATNAASATNTFNGTANAAGATAPDLTVTVDGPHVSPLPGQSFGFLITVNNLSMTNASPNTVLTNILPQGLTLLAVVPPSGVTFTVSGNTVTYQLGNLVPQARDATTILVTATTAASGMTLTDTAIVTSSAGNSSPGTGTGSTTFTVGNAGAGAASLVVMETGTPTVVVGQNITYTLTVSNTGNNTATQTTVIDTLPAGLTFVSADGPAGTTTTQNAGVINSSLGNLAAHTSATITIVGTATTAGNITNTGTATTTVGVTNTANTTASFTTVVTKANTTTGFLAGSTTSVVGQPVAFTATVTPVAPGAGTPTGTVSFTEGATILGTASLSNGQATANISFATVGTHTVTAVFSGDGNFTASTSASAAQTVSAAATTTTVVSAPSSSQVGQAVLFTATVTPVAPGAGTPTGTVLFKDGSTTIGTGTVGSNGQASATISFATLGQHFVTAVYSGDANFGTSTSAATTQTVASSTSTTLTALPNPAAFGQPIVLTAMIALPAGSVTPTGTVTFLEGATVLGTGSVASNGQASFTTAALAVGTHFIAASYSGDINFVPSVSAQISVTVQPPAAGFQAFGLPVREAEGVAKNVAVVNFTDSSGVHPAASYQATINWGDGTAPTTGTVTSTGTFPTGGGTGGAFQVTATHTYASEGIYTVTVTLTNGTTTLTPTSTATVGGFVTQLYHDLLNRVPDAGGLAFWVNLLHTGALNRSQVVGGFWGSLEHRGIQVDGFYETVLHRAPDPAGRAFWVNQLATTGISENAIELKFLLSPEYQASHPDNSSYVTGLYHDLLSRGASADEVALWANQLASGAKSRSDVALLFFGSVEASLNAIDSYYINLLGRPADPQGQQNWLNAAQAGMPVQVIEVMFLESGEYVSHALAVAGM